MTTASTEIDLNATSLRDRKKVAAYFAIQKAGTELISEQGLTATTIEQIADRAGVSPRTVHRYFRTKESVLFSRLAHPAVAQAYRDAPAELDPIAALQHAIVEPWRSSSDPDRRRRRALRASLMDVPAVKRFAVETTDELAEYVRQAAVSRLDGDPDAELKAEIVAALARYISLAGYASEPIDEDVFAEWAHAMASLAADYEADGSPDTE
ncbi:TetR/AcrR family transcriptional regulator [Demequina rhizosphaerae]|uniref:TetR/AcrR family transcriptional regulator n=1 Tax=Demequina rhizosphaerae TaxID=1638985 RepID=UPI0007844211|nr:TetR/AcrR family transcriptional regulator [Demequina rhizosphaerae]